MRPVVRIWMGRLGFSSDHWPFLPDALALRRTGPLPPLPPPPPRPAPPPPARRRPRRLEGPRWPGGGRPARRTRRGPSLLARSRLAHGQRAPFERLGVEPANGLLGHRPVGELDEGEAARPSGLPIDGHDDLGRLSDGTEVLAELGLRGPVRQISYEQAN